MPGRVTKVNFSVGDTVQQGQVIAELDKSELASNIRKEEIGLESSIKKLENIRDKNENLEIEKSENLLDRTKKELKIAKKELKELKIKQPIDVNQSETIYQKKLSEISALEKRQGEVSGDPEEARRIADELEIAKKEAADMLAKKPLDDLQNKLERQRKENNIKEIKKSIEEQEDALKEMKKKTAREEELTDASSMVELQQISLRQSKTELNKYELVAPFTGVLTKIDFKVGDNLVIDEQKFANLKNPDILTVVTSLDQNEVVQAEIGQKAKITFSALPNKVFDGEIVELEESPKEADIGAATYEAIIRLDKQQEKMYSGMTAKVEIAVARKENVLTLPLLAVRDGDQVGEKYVLMKGEEEEEGERVVVEVGLSDKVNVEIIRGLQEGDEVLEADFAQLETDFNKSSQTMNEEQMNF